MLETSQLESHSVGGSFLLHLASDDVNGDAAANAHPMQRFSAIRPQCCVQFFFVIRIPNCAFYLPTKLLCISTMDLGFFFTSKKGYLHLSNAHKQKRFSNKNLTYTGSAISDDIISKRKCQFVLLVIVFLILKVFTQSLTQGDFLLFLYATFLKTNLTKFEEEKTSNKRN